METESRSLREEIEGILLRLHNIEKHVGISSLPHQNAQISKFTSNNNFSFDQESDNDVTKSKCIINSRPSTDIDVDKGKSK